MAQIEKTSGFAYVVKGILAAVIGSVVARFCPSIYKASKAH